MRSKDKLQIQQRVWGTAYYVDDIWKSREFQQIKKDESVKLKLKLIGERPRLTIVINSVIH